ncbi:PA-phosphatase like phosphoesterase [Caballeronia terrestris]|uniref:PA-phosphatase like phosphoesterase n=1 Tax=Caballeronia terrestris TaxID=1226301 RepID=A0A158KYU0_9BURK|nr:phosphatase PAP2 family protein [Caballeronia terrestris]SAL85770.1 PA-phosphatase like phosphoesterase [Caballeronia terrestris]
MNAFDTSIQAAIIQVAPSLVGLTHAVRAIANFYLFKGVVPLAILWAIWFKPGNSSQSHREMVVAILCSALIAFLVGRLLALCLPFRVRPIYDPNVHLVFPGADEAGQYLRLWSSFPSDNAMLWMSVAVGIFLVWRLVGVLAILHCVVFICLPRVYLGLHYPTDVIAGAAIGGSTAWLFTRAPLRRRFAPQIVRFIDTWPAVGYMLAFLFFFELATTFDEPRFIAMSVFKDALSK